MDSKPLVVVTWNARSLRSIEIQLSDFLQRLRIDVALITETHLKPTDNPIIVGFQLLRLDRIGSRGGGVAIAIRRGIRYTPLKLLKTTVIEAIGAEVHSAAGELKIFAAYCAAQCRRSNGLDDAFKRDLNTISRTNARFLLGGDFNARHRA